MAKRFYKLPWKVLGESRNIYKKCWEKCHQPRLHFTDFKSEINDFTKQTPLQNRQICFSVLFKPWVTKSWKSWKAKISTGLREEDCLYINKCVWKQKKAGNSLQCLESEDEVSNDISLQLLNVCWSWAREKSQEVCKKSCQKNIQNIAKMMLLSVLHSSFIILIIFLHFKAWRNRIIEDRGQTEDFTKIIK